MSTTAPKYAEFADILKRELEAAKQPERRQALLHDLARVFGEQLGDRDEAHRFLDEAFSIPNPAGDLLWDAWRAAARRKPEHRIAALAGLEAFFDRPEEQGALKLFLSRLCRRFGDGRRAEKALSEASSLLPESRGVLWAEVEEQARIGDTEAVTSSLEKLATGSGDSAFRAALFLEVAEIRLSEGEDPSVVASLLRAALEEPGADWTVVNGVLRTGARLNDHVLVEAALVRMAESALVPEPEPGTGEPAGRRFQGFDRGEPAAAVLWWYISLIRQHRFGSPGDALEAIERACKAVPGSPFLLAERSRLLEACGRAAEALEQAPPEIDPVWKAESALASGNPQAALDCAEGAHDLEGSIFRQVLSEVVHGVGSEAPRELGELIAEESGASDWSWASLAGIGAGEPWPIAVGAVIGEDATSAERAKRFIDLAEQTADLNLRAGFLAVAGRLCEAERDRASSDLALQCYRGALELNPDEPGCQAAVNRLLHALGRWSDLTERLADTSAVTGDALASRIHLHEQAIILEQAEGDASRAAEVVADLRARDPEDVAALWSTVRLAFRLGDWQLVLQALGQLERLCPEDAPTLALLQGETSLLASGNYDQALQHFERAAAGGDATISQAARIYGIYVLHRLGDLEGLFQALEKECASSGGALAEAWLPELLETGRMVRGATGVIDILDRVPDSRACKFFWKLILGGDPADADRSADALRALARLTASSPAAGACRTAAAALRSASLVSEPEFVLGDLDSPEALLYAAAQLAPAQDPAVRAEICGRRAGMAEERDELEWVEWMLSKAEAEEKAGKAEQAIRTLGDALDRCPRHPGLLGARAELFLKARNYADVVEIYLRLADYFTYKDEKIYYLMEAARILLERLRDMDQAEAVCKQALALAPGHAEAADLLAWALRGKGDDQNVAKLLEERIRQEKNPERLIALYEEQADQFLSMDDFDSAIATLDRLIALAPDSVSASVTKIELLASLERWGEVIATIRNFVERTEDVVEARHMSWRAAEFIADRIGDPGAAIPWLEQLWQSGDRHPETERRIAALAERAGDFETAAAALVRLETLLKDEDERVEVKLQEAKIRLEKLFDDDGATAIVKRILASKPGNLTALSLFRDFAAEEEAEAAIDKAIGVVREALDNSPTDLKLVEALRDLGRMRDETDLVCVCEDVAALLRGEAEPNPGEPAPQSGFDVEALRQICVHPDEVGAASRIAEMVGEMSASVYEDRKGRLETGRKTRIDPKAGDPVVRWADAWSRLLGFEMAEVHRAGDDSKGAVPLPGAAPAVAVTAAVQSPLSAGQRFYIARNLWRSARGVGAFEEGDTAGPCRWVVAIAAVVVGERVELPLPTDSEIVNRAKKAMSRRLRRELADVCNLLLKEDRRTLRAWATALSYSADRFGLLAATRLAEVMPLVVEEAAGEAGTARFAENRAQALAKIPRCVELLRFALSQAYLDARRRTGLSAAEGGGER